MQVLVADEDISSRVMVETMLRERGHTVRNCDDGFEAAKVLSASPRPRVAFISNTLGRLRGLDVSRFLCATGKKNGVYVILVCNSPDMELLELCRRAGVDDLIDREIGNTALAARFDAAERTIELEDELARIQGILHGLSNIETPLQKKARALREANAALLGTSAKKEEAAPQAEQPKAKSEAAPAAAFKKAAPKASASDREHHERVFRGFQIVPEKEKAPPQSESNSDAALPVSVKDVYKPYSPAPQYQPFAPPEQGYASAPAESMPEEHSDVLASAEMVQNEELADEEIIHPFEFDDIILNVFSGMGVTLKSELPPKPIAEGPLYASWVAVAIPTQPVWLDVIMIAGEEGAKAVTAELLGQSKANESDVCEMFAELQNMVQGALRRYLEENHKSKVLQLAIPRASRRESMPPLPMDNVLVESGFSFNGEPLQVILFEHKEFKTCDNVMQLMCYDFLCDAVVREDANTELLVTGVVIRNKEKDIIDGFRGKVKPFRLMHASPFVKTIGPERLLEAPGAAVCCAGK